MTRHWIVFTFVLGSVLNILCVNGDEGQHRGSNLRRRLGVLPQSGILGSSKPIDPSRGRRRQSSSRRRPLLSRFKENISVERINELTILFKANVERLRGENQLDLIFVIDESHSVGSANFADEIKFVSRFVSGIEVDMNHTRVAVVTYADNVTSWVNQVSMGGIHAHKCSLLGQDLPAIDYLGGGTFTKGALTRAEIILENAREDSKKVVFLITDGYSNGGDPRPMASFLKRQGVELFTFGIKDGDKAELTEIASSPKEGHRLILNSFKEFEMVARRALHSDHETGNFIVEDDSHCEKYCTETRCCHGTADCRCGTTTGKYECVCKPGYYGPGLKQDGCQVCPVGTYKPEAVPGDAKTCIPCPDARMSSPEAATSLDQCICAEGFKKEHDRCEPLMCEGLSPPENGRFLACHEKYQSTCTSDCNNGYDLQGTATIVCNREEIWTALDGTERQEALCQVRYCEALETPDNGTMTCTNDDNSYSTVCDFECEEGYQLYGSSNRICETNRRWTGAETECRQITCPGIPRPYNGVLSGECGTARRPKYGDQCSLSCPGEGFELLTPPRVTCSGTGQWHPPVINEHLEICKDTLPPEITCPPDMTVTTLARKAYAAVTWELPVVTDNSGMVTFRPTWTFPVSLRIGQRNITYAATDFSGLITQCHFTVIVEDHEPPMIDYCRGPQPFTIERGETEADGVEWIIPTFTDNSGILTVTGNASFGTFPIGLTPVQYLATDEAGNTRSCLIDIYVQDNTCTPRLHNPRNGRIACQVIKDVTECEMICDTEWFGFAMISFGNPIYTCDPGSETWTERWDVDQRIPMDCSMQKFSNQILQDVQVTYEMPTSTLCNDTDFIAAVRQTMIDTFSDKISQICVDQVGGHLTCTLVDVTVTCVGVTEVSEPDYESTEEHNYYDDAYNNYYQEEEEEARRRKRSVKKASRIKQSKFKRNILKRFKRQYEAIPAYDEGTDDYADGFNDDAYGDGDAGDSSEVLGGDYGGAYGGESDYSEDAVPLETLSNADSIGKPDTDVNVNFDGSEALPQDEITDLVNSVIPDIIPPQYLEVDGNEVTKERLEITLTIRGEVNLNGITIEGDRIRHTNMVEFIRNVDIESVFTNADRDLDVHVVNRTAGDYRVVYVDGAHGQSDELICPIGTELRNKATCVNCPVGTYYDVITAKCKSCPVEYYQDHEAQLSCQPCPTGTATVHIHSRDLSECKKLCEPGFYSETGTEICEACPQGQFVDFYGAIKCAVCPKGTGTIGVASDSVEDCGELCEPGLVSDTGFAPCRPCPAGSIQEQPGKTFCYICPENKGVQMEDFVVCADIAPGRMEDLAALYYSECFAEPCKNNATCRGHGSTFNCRCQPGYQGDLCEAEIDECSASPCAETATCVDLLNAFRCECAPGYGGVLCEDEIDECTSGPCQNGATCVNLLNAFSCDCVTGYEGELCETDTDDCAANPCQNNGTCVDEVDGFHCECAIGFEGAMCQINLDDCELDPCFNEATCVDGINEFRCDCKAGYTGVLCSEDIDECSSDPCLNGECLDLVNSYKCLCPPTYLGDHCDEVGDPYFDLYFGKPNTYEHVKLEYALPNMTEVTVSFYLHSNCTETYGTPFSYAVGDGKDADTLTLTDLSALTLYVNGEFAVSDSRPINDDNLYLVTVVWTSELGKWFIYLNGQLEDSGKGLATGQAIPGGGTLVIGQEQDSLGGDFSASQEFLGTISQFNIHDYAFTPNDVLLLWRNCANHIGNVRAWPEMGDGIIGKIERTPTHICLPCPTIETDEGTMVHVENDYSIAITCNDGHEPAYRVRRRMNRFPFRCGSDGIWKFFGRDVDADLMRCEKVSCPDLEEVTLGSVSVTGMKFGDAATYNCDPGYAIVGSEQRTCGANKRWSHRAPTCEDVDECLSDDACHARADCTNSIGDYSCACVYGWKGDGHTCGEIDCGGAGSLQFGSISGNNFKLDGVVHYSCDYGYRLEGPTDRTCLFNDSWSGEMPVCVKVECPEPEDVRHSSKRPRVATRSYKSEITYTCHPGYYMIGNDTRECGPDSRWTGSLPSCERVSCDDPPLVSNAIIIKDGGIKYGDIIHYVCEQEYRPLGDSELRCNASKMWDAPNNKDPVCEHPTCNDPPSIINGQYGISTVGESTVTEAVYTYATEVQYVCNIGYNLVGRSILTCKEREAWDEEVPRCNIVSCGPPPIVANADQESNGELYGDLANYMCKPGYLMKGEAALTCLASGKWIDNKQVNPSCYPRPCGAPHDVDHSQQLLSGTETHVYKAVVGFVCDLGYWASGIDEITCDTEGDWVPEQNFHCDIAVCPDPTQPQYGTFSRQESDDGLTFEYNDTIDFVCDAGFYSVDFMDSRCTENGTWSHSPPLCLPVECRLPETVVNSTFRVVDGPYGEGAVFESTIVYTCDIGYQQSAGDMRRKCTEDSVWTGEPPACSRVECGVAPFVQYATPILNVYDYDAESDGDNLFYLDEIGYICNVGFNLEGEGTVKCTANMSFTEPPACEPISCGEPPVVQYSTIRQNHVYGENVYQSTVTYSCEQDFKITGTPVSMCDQNGNWASKDPVVCVPITCDEPDAVPNAFQFVSATEEDVAYPEIYKSGKYQPRSAAITACDKGYEILEAISNLRSVEAASDEELARGIATKSIDKLTLLRQDRIRKILSKVLDEEPQLAALVADGAKRVSLGAPKTLLIRQCDENIGWLKAAPKCKPMLCPLPFNLGNGHLVNVDEAEETPAFGTGIQYACDEGYKFASSESIDDVRVSECEWSDDLWNVNLTSVPECLPLPCPVPPSVADGSSSQPDGENFVFQDIASYTCNEGYEMTSGSRELRCESSQTWSGEPPSCSRVECPEPTAPLNGRFVGRTWTFEAVISFRCDKGYNLNGTANLTCQAQRTWSAPFPRCNPVPCGNPHEVQNSNALTTSEVYGGCAIYTCKHGFYLNGYAKIKCTAAGTWQENLPTCEFMLCPKPPVTSHVIFADSVLSELFSDRDSGNYIYDDVVTYSCEEGYETDDIDDLSAICLTGENIPNIPTCDDIYYITDVINGYWSRPPPVCTAKDCGPPPAAHENGIVIVIDTTFNNTVHYRCKNGYYTNDEDPTATCLSNAQWSRLESPECLPVLCGEPETPENGYFNGTVFTFKGVISYGCDDGHDLEGPSSIRCQATATWSDFTPTCVPKDCGKLPLVENGKLSFEDTIFGEEVIYSCNSGYYLKGRSLFECTKTGMWSHPTPPQCLPVNCGLPMKPKNGLVNATGHVFMDRAFYKCLPGYNQDGDSEIECLANASWSSPPPKCEPVDCENPPSLQNTLMEINGSTTFQSTQKYTCNAGYEMDGSGIVTCKADATWSNPPTCTRVKCPSPGRPQNGVISAGAKLEYVFEDAVEYICNQGYLAAGETLTTCTASRTWSHPLPRCQPVDCGVLPHIVHGSKSGWQTTFMTVINYSCWPGFYIAGNSSLECLHTGEWNSAPPTCERVSCGRPPHLKHGSVSGADGHEDWVFETQLKFSCNAGYHLHGGSGAECAEDGEWIFDFNFYDDDAESYEDKVGHPICEIIRCPEPSAINHGHFATKEYTYGNPVTYTCDEGHEKGNDGEVLCTGTGTSSKGYYVGEPPVCNPVSCGEPRPVQNGLVTSDSITYQGLAIYTCDDGHNLIGDPVAECLAGKRWSTFPRCDPKNCGLPDLPEFSNMSVPSTLYQTVLSVECEKGYDLQGSDTMNCTSEGFWSNQGLSDCTPVVCGDPQSVDKGIFSFNGVVFRSRAVYQCQSGYNLVPQGTAPIDDTVAIKCQADGTWQDGVPRCDPVECGPPPTTENGHSDVESTVVFPLSVSYECDYGYSFGWFATTTLYCTTSGAFSGSAPQCYPVTCGAPPSRENTVVDAEAYTYQNMATYTCKLGYVMVTEEGMGETYTSQCTGDGMWRPQPPVEGCVPYNCGPPLILLNHKVPAYTTNTTFGSLYTYECIEGHEAPADTLTVTCQRYGEWSAGPNCQPVDCGDKVCPTNAVCENSGTIFDSIFQANCIEGYEFQPMVASYAVRCTAEAIWSDAVEIGHPDLCVRLSCGSPPDVANARAISGAPASETELYGSQVQYVCQPGYDREGTDTMACLADGTWGTDPPPICVPKDCEEPPPCIDEANCTFNTTTYMSFVTVSCNEGYELQRDVPVGNLRCMESGDWEQADPDEFACLALECLSLPVIKHGRTQRESNGKNPTYQDKVGYDCDFGYYVEGVREVTCQSDRTYTEIPECLPVSCGKPPELVNGEVESTGETYHHRANYQCAPGYYMDGVGDLICSADGQWIAERTPTLAEIPVARMAAPSVYTTRELQIMLSEASGMGEPTEGSGRNQEITRDRKATRGDVKAGQQSDEGSIMEMQISARSLVPPVYHPPTCHPVPCGVPPKVANAEQIFTTSLVFTESVTFSCKSGFEMVGEAVLHCQSNGRFGPNSAPTCVRVQCPMPEATKNCELVGKPPFKFEDTLTYRPLKGFQFSTTSPSSPLTLTCMENGRSNISELPSCVPVSCGIPPTPLNGRFQADDFTYQHTAVYSCEPGYDLTGPPNITCLSTRQWSSDAPGCRPVSCGIPPFLTLGSMKLPPGNVDPFTYGQSVEYTCDLGYQFDSEEAGDVVTIHCQYNRSWDSSPPECVPVPCPELPAFVNGEYNVSGEAVFRAKANYKCAVGQEMKGEPLLICQADGTWSNVPPFCNPVSCDFPPRVPYSQQDVETELVYGQSITYECIPGYQLDGSLTLTCSEEKEFDNPPPVCTPIECEPPPELEFGHYLKNAGGFLFMSSVTYRCTAGYRMISEDDDSQHKSVRCEWNREWSGGPPKCEIISCGDPEQLENGYVDFTSTTYGSMIAYSCEPGFEISKNSSHFEHCLEAYVCMICQANEIWGNGNSVLAPTHPVCSPVSCGEPPDLDNASSESDMLVYKGTTTYTCHNGYEFPEGGEYTLECWSSAQWGPLPAPTCQRVQCHALVDIDFGKLLVVEKISSESDEYVYGDIVTYVCDEGYEPSAVDNLTCGADKLWDSEPPECNPVDCGSPPPRKHGYLVGDDVKTTFQNTVTYDCDVGYEYNGEQSELTCTTNGEWSFLKPLPCTPVDCGPPPDVLHGTYSLDSNHTFFHSEVDYVCDIGHELSGDRTLSCHSDKLWKPSAPRCNPVSCSVPPQIEHGAPDLESEPVTERTPRSDPGPPEKRDLSSVSGYVYQDTVRYLCDIGYTAENGEQSARCNENGTWADLPTCILVTCNPLPARDNSMRIGEDTIYESAVSYVCDEGYKLENNETSINCICGSDKYFVPSSRLHEDGTCRNELPECVKVSCGPPPVVANSVLDGDKEEYVFEEEIVFSCVEGHEMRGESVLGCNANGRFDHAPPQCLRISCGIPQPVDNAATIVSEGTKFGDTVSYECYPGYLLMSETGQRGCQAGGSWSDDCVKCAPLNCTDIIAPEFGSILAPHNVTFGSVVLFGCEEGYDLIGKQIITCVATGNWSWPTPECLPILCDPAPIVENGIPFSNFMIPRFGDVVEFICLDGYEIRGSEDISCLSNGSWTTPPTCPPVKCVEIPEVPNSIVENAKLDPFTYGQRVQYVCNPGYHLASSQSTLTCQADETFSSESVTCEREPCPPAPEIQHGTPSSVEAVYGDWISYDCDEGYHVFASDSIRCGMLGAYVGPVPTCEPVLCGVAPAIQHAFVPMEKDDYVYEDVVFYECEEGYEFVSGSVSSCEADGSFSPTDVQCSPITCKGIPTEKQGSENTTENVDDASHIHWTVLYEAEAMTFMSEAILTCEPGFVLESGNDEEKFVCQANKTWSGDFSRVKCVPIECPKLPTLINGNVEVAHSPEFIADELLHEPTGDNHNHVFGARAVFTCKDGYNLEGAFAVTCGEEGRWSSLSPTCVPVTCENAPPVENALLLDSPFTYGMIAEYECNEDYYLSSEAKYRTCRADGSFSEEEVVCSLILCPELPETNHGAPRLNVSRVGDENSYICEPGFVSNEVVQCLPSGEWSGGMESCSPVECNLAPIIDNAQRLRDRDFVYGDTATYMCDEGYALADDSDRFELACQSDGSFLQPESGCLPVKCDLEHAFKNGRLRLDGENAVFGDVSELVCNEGYEGTGSQEVICTETGEWNSDDAGCEIVQCGVAPRIENARPVLDQDYVYSYSGTVKYTCDEGYELANPDDVITCQADGSFTDADADFCAPAKCIVPGEIGNGSVSVDVASYGEELVITCDVGYEVDGFGEGEIVLLCEAGGQWSEDVSSVVCVRIECDALEPLENGEIFLLNDPSDTSTLLFDTTILYQCNTGYTLKGVAKQNCLPDGSWSSTLPECDPVECGPPPFILHGTIDGGEKSTYGHEISYQCDEGYRLDPPESVRRTCSELGSWTGSHPICTIVNCGPPPILENGEIDSYAFTYESEIEITCDEGYVMTGDSARICLANGTWSGEDPACQRISCGRHPEVKNGVTSPEDASFTGDEVQIICDEGFELFGDRVRVCEIEGEWVGVEPRCDQYPIRKTFLLAPAPMTLRTCGTPFVNGTKIKLVEGAEEKDLYNEGEKLEYCCSPGYIPTSVMTIQCVGGSWTGAPKCISQCRKKCHNRGRCSGRNRCTCAHGWEGSRCHKPVCTLPCLNGGFCSGPFLCSCKSGWTGTRCQTPVCSAPCKNGGRCENPDSCYCPYGYGGADCSEKPFFSLW